ncbi:asparagine synthase (glutamine-hydrolyzing) [Rhodovibrionaceae bacterium A322]
MCGIAGYLRKDGKPAERGVIERMTAALRLRGPDAWEFHLDGPLALGHTRLAIVDPSRGHQPMYGPQQQALVCNGEIYNYRDLKADTSGYAYQSESDSEVVLGLYDQAPADDLSWADRLRGMYAFALYDPTDQTLVLGRDPFGIKPLYLFETPELLAFASEPKAFYEAGLLQPELEEGPLEAVLCRHHTFGEETPLSGVTRLKTGQVQLWRQGRLLARRDRPAIDPTAQPLASGLPAQIEQLDGVLAESVLAHQPIRESFGLFLSGGVDSSALLSLLARQEELDLVTLTATFDTPSGKAPGRGDKLEIARSLAKAHGAEHIEVRFGEQDFWTLLPEIAAYMDDPVTDYAILPSWKLAAKASERFKVVLSGEGADELFAGYGRYRRAWLRKLKSQLRRLRGAGPDAGYLLARPSGDWRRAAAQPAGYDLPGGQSALQDLQASDIRDWLPNDLLIKLDNCLMAHGMEGRTPFLDPKVAAFAFNLPDSLKIQGRDGKWLLKTWLKEKLPKARPFDRKQGFTVPVGDWLAAHQKTLADLLPRQPLIAQHFRPQAVRDLYLSDDKNSRFLWWALLFLATWHAHRFGGLAAGRGDLFDRLSQAAE